MNKKGWYQMKTKFKMILDAGKLQLGAGLIYIVIIGTAGTVSGLIGFRRD